MRVLMTCGSTRGTTPLNKFAHLPPDNVYPRYPSAIIYEGNIVKRIGGSRAGDY